MTAEGVTSFLTYYVQGLKERTREEKSGTKYGFDWIIYNLGLSEKWTPLRLPFLRSGPKTLQKRRQRMSSAWTCHFLSANRKELTIFVLKDEVLNSKNWCNNSFDVDLRKAAIPDLSSSETSKVRRVRVILAYNKDEDRSGRELFDRFVANQPKAIGNGVALVFETWNLTVLVERIQCSLLSPSLLPQRFFSHFSYLCSQFSDFAHGSDEWSSS